MHKYSNCRTMPYKKLSDKMNPKAREAAANKAQQLLKESPLQELRQARQLK